MSQYYKILATFGVAYFHQKQMHNTKRATRIQQKENSLKAKINLASALGTTLDLKVPHKYAERPIMRCSNSNCVMCGNPRKFQSEATIAEKSWIEFEKFCLEDATDS